MGLLVTAAYVALPWWLPEAWLRSWLADRMSRQMGVPVEIDAAEISWEQGLQLEGLRIYSPERFGREPMVEISSVAMDFSPLRALVTKTVDWMEIDQPRVHVRIDGQGEVNLAPLQLLQFDFEAERITVRRALGIVELPDAPGPLQVEVHDMQLLRGQATRFGKITFSGGIEQQPVQAPLSGQVSISQAGTSATASMAFSFSDVRLDQLLLRQLLGLPLRRLTGRASGSLDLHVNRQGIVDQFSLDVGIRRLDAQPLQGPTLPVIAQAGLELAASYDPLTQIVDVSRLRLRLPGIDLDGSGQVYDEFALGNWQALESLQLAGTVRPSQVLALLTGRTELAGDVRLDGPIRVHLQLEHAPAQLDLTAEIDATAAGILRGNDVIKPPGRTLQAALAGRIDDRVWRLDVQQSRLRLGGNTFTGTGSLADLRDLLADSHGEPYTLPERLAELAGRVRWQGSARLTDLAEIAELDPQLKDLLAPARLAGPVTAEMSFNGPAGNRFALLLDMPAETGFRYGRDLLQQSDQDLQLALSGRLDPAAARLDDGSLTVNLNQQPALRVSRLDLLCPSPDHCAGSGRVWLDQIGQLCRLLPAHQQQLRGLSGSSWMQFRFGCRQGRFALDLSADLSAMGVDWPGRWNKPVRRRRDVDRVELSVRRAGADRPFEVQGLARTRGGELTFSGALGPLGRLFRAGRLDLALNLDDAAELPRAFPALQDRLAGVAISGPVRVRTGLEFHPDRADWTCRVASPGLALALPVDPARSIRAALAVDLRGTLRTGPDRWQLAVTESKARIGEDLAAVSLAGTLALAPAQADPPGPEAWPDKLTGRAQAELTVNLDRLDPAVAKGLLPRPGSAGLTGRLDARLDLRLEPTWARVDLDVLADRIRIDPTPLGTLALVSDRVDPRLGRVVVAKPDDVEARLSLQARIRRSDGEMVLESGSGRIGALSASVRRPRSAKENTRLVLWTDRAEDLPQLLPDLAEMEPSGTAWLQVEISSGPGRIESVHLRARDLQAELAAEAVSLNGELRAEGLDLAGRPDRWTVRHLRTDGLRIGIGRSHGWLLARLRQLPDAPAGRIELLAGKLDDRALLEWARRLTAAATDPPPATADRAEAMARANRQVAMLRRLAARADLSVRVHCRDYVNFDPRVEQTYHLAQLELQAALGQGQLSVAYDGALSGGKYIGTHRIDLTASEPIVHNRVRMRDVIATENIQPQLAIYFPGNTVLGYFNRDETTHAPLAQTLAGLDDVQWRPWPIGTALTITTDGYVVGQAAPGFVTGIFPGLNLARYRYQKMTGFTEFRPDATAVNDMIFDGQDYDVYMEGTTDQANRVDYEVGLLVLGAQSPEWHHAWRQGRLPVLKVTGRIHNGQLRDQEVSFPWPNETIGTIFVRNSIFYRMWVNWRGDVESP